MKEHRLAMVAALACALLGAALVSGRAAARRTAQLSPGERVWRLTYDVKIRDKWDVNIPRVDDMRARVNAMIGEIGEEDQYESVDHTLKGLLRDLDGIRQEEKPEALSSDYVAFFRGQAVRLDMIEQRIHRIEAALRPVEKKVRRGFRIQPPSLKTTWMIIYVILIFLGVISFIFFLRWMGRSKAERME